ncbi:hypothetical protein FGG08_000719 [Glutinoglossum americanum]|uniref:Uncharacterized protein n=1 Tax=Glutinoglossum americanum TaxID=1670608 RepID=A0A9P8L5W4_9PEZI|nr:hypothetical protein FGG08_000719 [Glutinoglossum americanum]
MAEPAQASTPGSATNTPQGKSPAPKDKSCPFCHQHFTSSSLGRHLDLYIKEKNPKPPDGVHIVEEIRKLRGNITRRQARHSSAKREGSTPAPASSAPPPQDAQRSPSINRSVPEPLAPERVGMRFSGELPWQVTGVIRDTSKPLKEIGRRLDTQRENAKRYYAKNGVDKKQKIIEARDNGRAAELALKEVLGSIKAANARIQTHHPLDFNPHALNFPALTLRCLSPPPTLFSAHTFPSVSSWSIDPPGQMQYEGLIHHFRDKFRQWRLGRGAMDGVQKGGQSNANGMLNGMHVYGNSLGGHDASNNGVDLGQQEEEKVLQHLHDAFNYWTALQEQKKNEYWRLEVLRGLSHSEEKRKKAQSQLEQAEQEIEQLKAQVDRLTKLQRPDELVLNPTTSLSIAAATARELNNDPNANLCNWDYDRLVSKWKAVIQENRRAGFGMAGQRYLPGTPQSAGFPTAGGAGGMMVNGTSQYAGMDEDEEDDDDGDLGNMDESEHNPSSRRAPRAMMDRSVLDGSLGGGAGGMAMDCIDGQNDVNSEGFLGGRMLMGLSASDFAGMNGSMNGGMNGGMGAGMNGGMNGGMNAGMNTGNGDGING